MTIDEAAKWVDENKGWLAAKAKTYTNYAPYLVSDYLQDAYEAAIKAAICCQRNPEIDFHGTFRNQWKRMIAKVTPFPDEAREAYAKNKALKKAQKAGEPQSLEDDDATTTCDIKKKPYYSGGTSMSIPKNFERNFECQSIDTTFTAKVARPKINLEKVFEEQVKPLLSEKEAIAMEYAIGTTVAGILSEREIAEVMGVSRDTVRVYLNRGYQKASKARVIKMADKQKKSAACEEELRDEVVGGN